MGSSLALYTIAFEAMMTHLFQFLQDGLTYDYEFR
jgi:hypothetical protein